MSDQDGFDARLAAHFEQGRQRVPADSFVATTMRKVRAGRRRKEFLRVGLLAAALVMAVIASPWLIAGAARLNEVLESLLAWRQYGMWVVGAVAVLAVLATRVRSR